MRVTTPVLIWQDLPEKVRWPDSMRQVNVPIPRRRCLARSRGEYSMTARNHVPLDGGYRCVLGATNDGLCYRHFNDATDEVRERAKELAGMDSPLGRQLVTHLARVQP